MKELSINEKAKAYDEALKKASAAHKDEDRHLKATLERIFPELKEGDDERIKKNCIHFLELQKQHHAATFEIEECIDWLEKQGEQLADKSEPRFEVGDWVVRGNTIAQILDIQEQYYIGLDINGKDFVSSRFLDGNKIHLWTIQDAKDGDVLACNEEILAFKSYSSLQGRISLYCWYNGHTNNFHSKEVIDILLTTRNKVCPATKEQRDALMKVMNDAGYEWDADKKELKKEKAK